MNRVFSYDLARLFLGPFSRAPRGIDRIDLAIARFLFQDAQVRNVGILPTPWGMRAFDAATVQRGLASLEAFWAENAGARVNEDLDTIARLLQGSNTTYANAPTGRLSLLAKVQRIALHLHRIGLSRGTPVSRAIPPDSIYLNVGQIGLAVPLFFRWLRQRPDVTCAVMLHDTIPLQFPRLVDPASVSHHARMIRTAARHADCVITSTEHAASCITAALREHGREDIPALVRSLPLPHSFAALPEDCPPVSALPYFVAVSTIEPRKNHALLIALWRRLLDRLGSRTPPLILIGSRGWSAEAILQPLIDTPALGARVHALSGVSSPVLARLMAGATAILCPSLAEGFGMSVQEANALGVPAIASDIAAHREVAAPGTLLLPVDDIDAWERAILAIPLRSDWRRPPLPQHMTEAAYCADIIAFAERCASEAIAGQLAAGRSGGEASRLGAAA